MTRVRGIVGRNLRQYRQRLQLSQEQLSEICGYSNGYIGEIESGRKYPSATALERICEALGVKPFQLYLEDEQWEVRDRLDSISSMYREIQEGVEKVLNAALRNHLRH